ncbi:MAG TPA: polysaccharide deacetylase family protein [Syntrophorhabdaceae bacterium]|nr:polysaccharide deacetylase family protein [Syntrophorhabdaceae bacterium]
MLNALCFDIDDLAYGLHMKCGSRMRSHYLVEKETYSLLQFLDRIRVRATMFVPGYVAERFPQLVRDMAVAGHEIGGHGNRHIAAQDLQRHEFRNEIRTCKHLIEDIVSLAVTTYKDPCWGISPQASWAYDELISEGYTIDNTAQPVLLQHLGKSPKQMSPFLYKDALTVIPVTSITFFRKRIPFNGGLYCAYVPSGLQKRYYRKLNERGIPFNYFCHPFELCPQDENKHIYSRGSVRAAFYGLYFGWYRHYITVLSETFELATLKDTYASFLALKEDDGPSQSFIVRGTA